MEVQDFTLPNFSKALSNNYTSEDIVKEKNHFTYLSGYLGIYGLDAKTIVIENDYVSKDYLHDFVSYYSLCFENYPKTCKRLHFFNLNFSKEEFISALVTSDKSQEIWDSYLGFIVVRPIPTKVIGYTVLKTFSAGNGFDDRYF